MVTLVERWNGSRWSIQRSPTNTADELDYVACPSSNACTAVGIYSNKAGTHDLPLIEHSGTGTAWSVSRIPHPRGAALGNISCPSAKSCVIVGGIEGRYGDTSRRVFAERYGSR